MKITFSTRTTFLLFFTLPVKFNQSFFQSFFTWTINRAILFFNLPDIYPGGEVIDDHADNLVLLVLLHRFHAHLLPFGHALAVSRSENATADVPRIPEL